MESPSWYFPALIASVAAMALIRVGRPLRALLRRRPGEDAAQAWRRGLAERDEYLHAQTHALGSPRTTMVSMAVSVLLVMEVTAWCVDDEWYGYLAGLYLAAGMVVAFQLDLRHGEHWNKLTLSDRAWCRLVHAWIWPVHAWRSWTARRAGKQAASRKAAPFE